MSNVKLDKFYKEMFDDQNFKDSFIKICKKNKERKPEERFEIALKELIMPYAKSHNYNFTEEEIRSYESEKLKNLSEEDLENVSGGLGVFSTSLVVLTTLLSLTPSTYLQWTGTGIKQVSSFLADTIDNSANARYIKNAIGDAIGLHGVIDPFKKVYNYAMGTTATPESETSLQARTGLTTVTSSTDPSSNVNFNASENTATLISGASAGGLGCSTDTLLGYIKTKLGNDKYKNLKQINLIGFSGVALGGTSDIPIVYTDLNGKVKSIRIPSKKDKNFNFVYYPETNQMYIAGSGTPTITQNDLDNIKALGKLGTDIDEIKITGWKTNLAVRARQQLNFDEGINANWENINDSWGNYHYYNKTAREENNNSIESRKRNELNSRNENDDKYEEYNKLPFKQYLDETNGVSMDNDGTLTINFKEGIGENLKIDNDVITTLKDYYKFRQGQNNNEFNNDKIRMNFISSKPNIEGLPAGLELTTAIIKNNFVNDDKSKFTEVTITSKEQNGHRDIKDENGSIKALIFGNFKAVQKSGTFGSNFVEIEPTNSKDPKAEITIDANDLDLIAKKFGVNDIYSRGKTNCKWKDNSSSFSSYYHYTNQQ